MIDLRFQYIEEGKKLYFASDFHLGVPDRDSSLQREKRIISWLDDIAPTAAGIVLVGDIFDFWFEYKHVIPKGFIRFQGKLASLSDEGIPIVFFTGNHDMWMFGYFTEELGIPIYQSPTCFECNGKVLYVGHGDGLGPGDYKYKVIKRFFGNHICQWFFNWLHPNVGMWVANRWSYSSRKASDKKEDKFKGDDEWLIQYIQSVEASDHHDYYIFGHRHMPIDRPVGDTHYINLGDWLQYQTYASFDGSELALHRYEG